ncbi:MAG: YcaO-like family protein, partial [Acidimicrobiia bacterium]
TGRNVLLPAEVVLLNFTRFSRRRPLVPVALAGIAAGPGPDAAIEAGLLELVERDATMRWWHAGLPATRIEGIPEGVAAVLAAGGNADIDQLFLSLPSALPVPVVGSWLHDRRRDILVAGFAARPELDTAMAKASAEAWQLHRLSALLLEEEGPLWQEITAGRLPLPVVPYRADRTYRHAFRADYGDMHQLALNLQYHLDPETHERALDRLAGEACVAYDDLRRLHPPGRRRAPALRSLTAAAAELGMEIHTVDLTTADLAGFGLAVTRVTSPDLVGNTATAFLPLGHPAMVEALAGRPARLEPLPHA